MIFSTLFFAIILIEDKISPFNENVISPSFWPDVTGAEIFSSNIRFCSISFSIALFLDVNISEEFNLPFYVGLTIIIPALLIAIFEKIRLSDIKNEFNTGNKKAILTTGITWGLSIFLNLRAYQLGSVTIIAPLSALTVMLNVIVGYLFLKERDSLLRKIISAILIIISIILIKI